MMLRAVILAAFLSTRGAGILPAQSFEQRGFVEVEGFAYPRAAPNDSGHFVGNALVRWEPSARLTPWLKFSAAFDGATDTHGQVDRSAHVDFDGRSILRPAFSVRRLSVTLNKGPVTAEIGRQLIRWGKTDVLNPIDRFAPKDYVSNVLNPELLGVTATRVTIESGGDTLDLVWQPWFTPSRTPLLNQRWTVLPPQAENTPIFDQGARYPGGSQAGARWNHVGRGFESSLCFFDGFNNLPLLDARPHLDAQLAPAGVDFQRYYPALRLYGADVAVPLQWVTLKGEAAYFTSPAKNNDEYVLYVIQLERQVKEWTFVAGYAGEQLTLSRGTPLTFAPDRGFAKSFVAHAAFTIDATRSLSLEAAARAKGSFTRFEYSQSFGQHWRTTLGLGWIRGDMGDFLGQYHRNSYASVTFRYSF